MESKKNVPSKKPPPPPRWKTTNNQSLVSRQSVIKEMKDTKAKKTRLQFPPGMGYLQVWVVDVEKHVERSVKRSVERHVEKEKRVERKENPEENPEENNFIIYINKII
jgi:hypothetical protein